MGHGQWCFCTVRPLAKTKDVLKSFQNSVSLTGQFDVFGGRNRAIILSLFVFAL